MGFFFKKGGFMDEIRCDEKDYLIWKWRPRDVKLGQNNRENAIRNGSSLRVKDGEIAIFVYPQENGKFQDVIIGPYDQPIKTKNFPILARLVGLAYDGGTPFQAEVYFINTSKIIHMYFGVPYFNIFDPRFLDFSISVAVHGGLNFHITNYQEFIKLHRLNQFSLTDFKTQIRSALARYIKAEISHTVKQKNIPAIQVETQIDDISHAISKKVNTQLATEFGITITRLDIETIEIDKTDENYSKLMRITQNAVTTRTEADLKDYTESLRIKREETQYATRKQTQTTNLSAFQVEQQAEVAKASAQAFGEMGKSGIGQVNLSESSGFNPMTMMAGMSLGSAIGQNMANTLNTAFNQNNHNLSETPPPIPKKLYFVVQEGKQTGPFDLTTIQELIFSGAITKNTLLWTSGMSEWQPAISISEISTLLIPDIPK